MKIKGGYNGKNLEIRISPVRDRRTAELWLLQEGLSLPPEYQKYKETLSYMTLEELMDLRDEVAAAIKNITS